MDGKEQHSSKPIITRRTILKYGMRMTGAGALSGIVSLSYGRLVEPDWLARTEIDLPLRNLPSAFDGFRVAHISDLHVMDDESVDRVISAAQQIRNASPDVVVISGDFVTYSADAGAVAAAVAPLDAPYGVYASLGNHDHWTDADTVRRGLKAGGVRELRNEHTVITRGSSAIYIAGVDDIWEQHHDLDGALKGIPEQTVTILLAHEPDYADETSADGRVSLQVSGHSHGGQVYLPFIFNPITPFLGSKYVRGLYKVGDMYLYTTTGIGMVPPKVRINCRPEIAIFTLRPA